MPVGRRSRVWNSKFFNSRRRIVSPAPPSNSTLSGITTAASPFERQHGHDVLQEVELLVRGGDEEVGAVVVLALAVDLAVVADDPVALLLAERRIGEDHVVALAAGAEQRVLGLDDRVDAGDAVEIEVHRRQAHHLRHDVDAGELVLQRRSRRPCRGRGDWPSCAPRPRAGSPPCRRRGRGRSGPARDRRPRPSPRSARAG